MKGQSIPLSGGILCCGALLVVISVVTFHACSPTSVAFFDMALRSPAPTARQIRIAWLDSLRSRHNVCKRRIAVLEGGNPICGSIASGMSSYVLLLSETFLIPISTLPHRSLASNIPLCFLSFFIIVLGDCSHH